MKEIRRGCPAEGQEMEAWGQRGQYFRQSSSTPGPKVGRAWAERGARSKPVSLCAASKGVGEQGPKGGLEG